MCRNKACWQSKLALGTSITWQYLIAVTRVFFDAVRDLAPPGDMTSMQTYSFEFNEVEMQYDSYRGLQVRLK